MEVGEYIPPRIFSNRSHIIKTLGWHVYRRLELLQAFVEESIAAQLVSDFLLQLPPFVGRALGRRVLGTCRPTRNRDSIIFTISRVRDGKPENCVRDGKSENCCDYQDSGDCPVPDSSIPSRVPTNWRCRFLLLREESVIKFLLRHALYRSGKRLTLKYESREKKLGERTLPLLMKLVRIDKCYLCPARSFKPPPPILAGSEIHSSYCRNSRRAWRCCNSKGDKAII
jgi:hypothetical protein